MAEKKKDRRVNNGRPTKEQTMATLRERLGRDGERFANALVRDYEKDVISLAFYLARS